jgi:hypothetical protein
VKAISIRYQPVEGGALGGHFALHVTLGEGNLPSDLTPTELATRVHDCFEKLALKCAIKGVLVDCRQAISEVYDMGSFLSTLKDWGYTILLWVGEKTRYSWFDPSYYIVAFVTSRHWPNFRVNEIRYVLIGSEDQWAEPDVYDVNANATCYVIPPVNLPLASITAFITGCKRPWGVIGKAAAIDFTKVD